MATPEIEHHSERNCFTLKAGDEEAVLEYRLQHNSGKDEPTSVNFSYTYVPPAFRGKGLGEALVRHGLKWAKQQNYNITATCWYAAKFLH